jgi:O-acetyl-ADP-ribose deacetylase (regulator of RNase III)
MIEFKTGNVLKEQVEALVNTVNCVGVMGRGVALQFKKAYPDNFVSYRQACQKREVCPGKMLVFETGRLTPPRYIINFPTKRHWRGKSRLEDIESGLRALVLEIEKRNITSIALPPLASGLGGRDWQKEIRPLVEIYLGPLRNTRVVAFEPGPGAEPVDDRIAGTVPNMTPGRAALIGLIDRYLAGLMDFSVTLLEVHKLMYFMQEAGEALRLRYVKAPYGPYAENLRHVLREIEGYYMSGYVVAGDKPDQELELVPGAIDDAKVFLVEHTETRQRFERVADLVEGFETPFGLELLSTVHWVAAQLNARTSDDVVRITYEWSERKRQFSEAQILLALNHLCAKGWIEACNT